MTHNPHPNPVHIIADDMSKWLGKGTIIQALQPNWNGLQPNSDGLQPNLEAMASKSNISNLMAMASNLKLNPRIALCLAHPLQPPQPTTRCAHSSVHSAQRLVDRRIRWCG